MKKNTLYNGSSLQWLRENKSNLKQISFYYLPKAVKRLTPPFQLLFSEDV